MKTAVRYVLAAATIGVVALAFSTPAHAAAVPVESSTTCTNPFIGPQPGPSAFEVGIPETAVVGDEVEVTVSFDFTNDSTFTLTDMKNFSQTIETTGTAQNPLTVTAGSQGSVPGGATITITQTGTWTPDEAGTATFTLGTYTFETVVAGFTVPITCEFDETPEAVSTVVDAA